MNQDKGALASFGAFFIFVLCVFQALVTPTDAVRPSLGCGNGDTPEGFFPGQTTVIQRKVPGTQARRHDITLPANYDTTTVPPPLMFYFHGWSGNSRECGSDCTKTSSDYGFLSVSMTGYGVNRYYAYNSWNFAGSANFPQPRDPVCTTAGINMKNSYCKYYKRAGQCACSDDDGCWWTTCFDSVQQVLSLFEELNEKFCFDLDQVWAVGCSNGGMFTYELARDERSAKHFRGIIPIVGLPHYGQSTGPLLEGTSMLGLFGAKDNVVPPKAKPGSDNPDKTQDTSGYLYTSYSKVVKTWTEANGCAGDGQDALEGGDDYGAAESGLFDCIQGCSEKNDTHVVGCIFQGGHVCSSSAGVPWEPIFNFMLSQPSRSTCSDRTGEWTIGTRTKDWCLWARSKGEGEIENRCGLKNIYTDCPVTCNSCECYDRADEWTIGAKTKNWCLWARSKGEENIDDRCALKDIYDDCPRTCNSCPSTSPTTSV